MGLRVSGLASGLDTAALVKALIQLERRPLDLVERQKRELETQQSLFETFDGLLAALRDAAAAIDNLSRTLSGPSGEEELLAFVATSSDESVLRASANGFANVGTTDARVVQLATSARVASVGFASGSEPIAAAGDTLTIDYGGASPLEISVGAAGASLEDLAALVNADPGSAGAVRADVVFDGTAYRLLATGTQTGAAHALALGTTIAGPGGAAFIDAAAGQAAADARLEVFGLSVTRPSNTVTDLIPGVTLELRGVSATAVQVQVERDDAAVGDRLQAFVDAYNAVMDFARQQSRFDPETEQAGPLSGDGVLRGIESRLQRLVVSTVGFAGNSLTSLAQIGVAFGDDGRLALDRSTLEDALATSAVAVRQLLSGDGTSDGIAAALARVIDPFRESETGILAVRGEALDARLRGLDRQIERLAQRLEKREELLVAQFTRMEALLAQIQSQGSSLAGIASPGSSS